MQDTKTKGDINKLHRKTQKSVDETTVIKQKNKLET